MSGMNPVSPKFPVRFEPLLRRLNQRLYPVAKFWIHDFEAAGPVLAEKWLYKTPVTVGQKLSNALVRPVLGLHHIFSQQDYKQFPVRELLVQPALGAMAMEFFGIILPKRLLQAHNRAEVLPSGKRDMREFHDVLRRDIPTLATLLVALDLLRDKWTIPLLQKMGQLRLMPNGKAMGFAQLAQAYTMQTPSQLITLLQADPLNQKGVLHAIEAMPTMGVKHWKQLQGQLKTQAQALVGALETSASAEKLLEHATAMFKTMDEWNVFGDALRRDLQTHEVPKAIERMARQYLPDSKQFLARYAQLLRLPADMLAFGLTLVFLGYGVAKFNEVWNRRQFSKQLSLQQAQPVSFSAPFQPVFTQQLNLK